MLKIDLHTHSIASPDGGINRAQYQQALHSGLLDVVAVTDHNRISFAQELQAEFGDRIIIGEEIMTTGGEIIGLYLEEAIKPGLTPLETIKQIKDQDGLVYIPHPFETMRKGLHSPMLDELADYIDIMEICNGRAMFQNRSAQAAVWARLNHTPGVASSDAHGHRGLGRTYTVIAETPTRATLLSLLAASTPNVGPPGLRSLLYPKYHRLRNKLRRRA